MKAEPPIKSPLIECPFRIGDKVKVISPLLKKEWENSPAYIVGINLKGDDFDRYDFTLREVGCKGTTDGWGIYDIKCIERPSGYSEYFPEKQFPDGKYPEPFLSKHIAATQNGYGDKIACALSESANSGEISVDDEELITVIGNAIYESYDRTGYDETQFGEDILSVLRPYLRSPEPVSGKDAILTILRNIDVREVAERIYKCNPWESCEDQSLGSSMQIGREMIFSELPIDDQELFIKNAEAAISAIVEALGANYAEQPN